jgi:hypothetical protein
LAGFFSFTDPAPPFTEKRFPQAPAFRYLVAILTTRS